jgi:hypothetical protein
MGFSSFLKGMKLHFSKDSEWESKLKGVDFRLASDMIADTFHIGEQHANKNTVLYSTINFVEAWEMFRDKPYIETAINLLIICDKFAIAPLFLNIFEKCKIGEKPLDGSKWESKLAGVDFHLARDEIAYVFHIGIEGAKKEGKILAAPKELVKTWESYLAKPCLENAIELLRVAPFFLDIFERCKFGGEAQVHPGN